MFNVSAAYTNSFHTPKQALDFDYAWEPEFSGNLNAQEIARKTSQMNLGKQTLAELGRLKAVREEYDKIFEQTKWMWNQELKEEKAQRRRENLANIIDAGADWIGNKNKNLIDALETVKAQRDAVDNSTGQGSAKAQEVIKNKLLAAGYKSDHIDEFMKSAEFQLPGFTY